VGSAASGVVVGVHGSSVGPGLYMAAIGAVFAVIGGLVADPAKANGS